MVFGLVNRPPESPWEGEAMVTHTRKATAGGEAPDALLGEDRDLLRASPSPLPPLPQGERGTEGRAYSSVPATPRNHAIAPLTTGR